MIAAGIGDNRLAICAKGKNRITGPAKLERAGALQAFCLDMQIKGQLAVQPVRAEQRRGCYGIADPLLCFFNNSRGYHDVSFDAVKWSEGLI